MHTRRLATHPAFPRAAPFGVYLVFLLVETTLPPSLAAKFDPHWLYLVQIAVTGGVLAGCWPAFIELRHSFGRAAWSIGPLAAALATGLVVFFLWHALDQPWASLGSGRPLDPAVRLFPRHVLFAAARVAGAVVLVPIMEELFWRSLVTRWIDRSDFLSLAPARISARALCAGAVLFGLEHNLLLAGIVAGLAFGELYRRSGNLWYAVIAHALTNALLEVFPVAG
jgi:CAAX prenyl protease-like protein